MLDRIYADPNFAVSATVTLGSPAETLTLAVIDQTRGVALDLDGVGVNTIVPAAAVQASALADAGVSAADLDDATLALAGFDWRVVAVRPIPGPDGEAAGEYLLLLERTL